MTPNSPSRTSKGADTLSEGDLANRFAAIGFGPPNELPDLTDRAQREGEWIEVPFGFYVRWAPGSGAELWLQLDRERGLLGADPYFDGSGHWRLGVTGLNLDARNILGGQLLGMAGVEDDPANGLYPLAIDVPDSRLLQRRLRSSGAVAFHLAAFARQLVCFPDEASFAASFGDEPVWAPEALVPTGLFLADGLPEQPDARAAFSGHILAAEIRVNPATSRPFCALSVQTYGGVCDVVAELSRVAGEPVPGGIVFGDFWLTARLAL